MHNQNQTVYLHGESLLNELGRGVFIPGHTWVQVCPGSAHRHPNEENKNKEKEFGRQRGKVVTSWIELLEWTCPIKSMVRDG